MSTQIKEIVTAQANLVKHPKEGSTLLAFATIKMFDGLVSVESVRVLKGNDGKPWVAMPGRAKVKDGKPVIKESTGKQDYQDYFHPNTAELRTQIHTAVLTAYAAAVAQDNANKAAAQ